MILSKKDISLISAHPYMEKNGIDFMQLNFCTKPYQVIERILINIASKNCITWKYLLQNWYNDKHLFIELCVALILIDKYLKQLFNIENANKLMLTGDDFHQVIQDYNNRFYIY